MAVIRITRGVVARVESFDSKELEHHPRRFLRVLKQHSGFDACNFAGDSVLQAAASFGTRWTSLIRPVSTSKIKPRTGTSLAIHGCDLTFSICSRVFCYGSLKENRRIGAGDESPVKAVSFAFSSASVNVVNPQPV